MLYKRAFRKEKEVATFLIQRLILNLPTKDKSLKQTSWKVQCLIWAKDGGGVWSPC